MSIHVRPVLPDDLGTITAIYGYHVLHGTASFEESPPDLAEITRRYQSLTSAGMPYFVAERDGMVIGFAYAGPFRSRSAYRYTVEDSVYVDANHIGRTVGKALLYHVIERAAKLGFRRMVSVIGDSANIASIALHKSCGFAESGRLKNVGYKNETWLDIVLMQRDLRDGEESH
jgi:phosphinothricin acetyltransferase